MTRTYRRVIFLCALFSAAAVAQNLPPQGHAAALSVTTSPDEIAESIVIFVPSVDTPSVTGDDEVFLKGRVIRTERGPTPGALVMPAHTLTGSRAAGVPVRMHLIKHPDFDAYYPIYTSPVSEPDIAPASSLSAAVAATIASLSVDSYSPLGYPTHTAPLKDVPYGFGAALQIESVVNVRADLYFGIIRPDGSAFTWTSLDGTALLAAGMHPLRTGIALDMKGSHSTASLFGRDIEHRFSSDAPSGMYLVFALLVPADSDPADATNWIAEDVSPLFVN